MNPTGDLLAYETDRPGFQWLDDDTVHTTYDMLLYGLDDVDYDLPLSPGSQVRVGPCRFRVLREEPETATVLLIREGGLGWRLRQVVLRAAMAIGRWTGRDEELDLRERIRKLNERD